MFGSRIICIHAINTQFTLVKLKKYINRMRALGYSFVAIEELLNSKKKKQLALTVDDAYLSVYNELLPYLVKENIPALLFVPTGLLGLPSNHSELINNRCYVNEATMGVKEINNWIASGNQIGFHTCKHLDWSQASLSEIESDFSKGWDKIIENGWSTPYFAYPFGCISSKYKKQTELLLKSYGIKYAFTLEWADFTNKVSSYYIPRVCLGDWEPSIWSVVKSLGMFDWYGNRKR